MLVCGEMNGDKVRKEANTGSLAAHVLHPMLSEKTLHRRY
jgi:hypothetical protein